MCGKTKRSADLKLRTHELPDVSDVKIAAVKGGHRTETGKPSVAIAQLITGRTGKHAAARARTPSHEIHHFPRGTGSTEEAMFGTS
jgi:hypothetical protein